MIVTRIDHSTHTGARVIEKVPASPLLLVAYTRVNIHVSIAYACASQHHMMRMEGGAGDGCGSSGGEERGPWLKCIQERAVHVEKGQSVVIRATANKESQHFRFNL